MNENVRELTEQSWQQEVLDASEPVLVDFWAGWCAPCRAIAPTIDQLATELAGRLKVGKLDVDEHGELAARYGVRSIPTLLVFKQGSVVEQRVGVLSRADLVRMLEAHLAPAGATAPR